MISTPNQPGKKVGDYIFTRFLGQGAFGQVFEAYNQRIPGKKFAVKCVLKSTLQQHDGLLQQLFQTEIEILSKCQNPNIVKFYEHLQSSSSCYVVLEYCDGDFEQLWRSKNKRFTEQEAITYLKQIINGFKGLHQLRVIHRDLKLPNLLILDGQIKIADLGFCKQLSSIVINDSVSGILTLGSLGCMAPEVAERQRYGIQADMWSLGSILYQMLYGTFPFSTLGYSQFIDDIRQRRFPDLNINGIQISPQINELLVRMLEMEPRHRIKWVELYDHPVIKDDIGAREELNLNNLKSVLLNPKDYKQIYSNQGGDLEQLQIQDQTVFISRQSNLQKPYIKEDQTLYYYQQTQQDFRDFELVEKKSNDLLQLYILKRNFYVFLVNVYDIYQRQYTENEVRIVFTDLMFLKKVYHEAKILSDSISAKKNIFNAENDIFNHLLNRADFDKLAEIVQNDLTIYKTNLEANLQSYVDNITFTQYLTKQQREELCVQSTENFDALLKDSIYQFGFNPPIQYINEDQRKNSKILIILMFQSILFQESFEYELAKDKNLNYSTRFEELNKKNIQQLDQEIMILIEVL